MRATRAAAAVVGILGLLETACLVDVTHVKDPGRAFERARDEVARDAGRGGRASHLNVLAWDRSEGEMVRVSVPLWLLRSADHQVDWDGMDGVDDDHERWLRHMKDLSWKDLERAGPGVLLEVTEDDSDRVLVWLR